MVIDTVKERRGMGSVEERGDGECRGVRADK
jgi:hypothetical protein